ncbi:hypothetical protein SPRG_05999 [Saprolegnia parasitica CBS 223.65]|uniref:START domain-containing protein n=1 Tax=Saprolegnia parasitica (strain CBS 223.65) TaxID=695850 RepID=A0A067CSE7_SAPPC|nr:hypothetical protein SPRG_05999 [Saprolegnia parasitica CBS 223.65]KDO29461.1 hypothetical protein SPRG_05999 [Saprolegnia parasitica CBS 223.65]|eukprot:XP_012199960.1 hypothetical protein SPRG_05999 [Saprolegnia parasitica CBS 223.65]
MAVQQATMENARLKRSLEDQLHLATALDKLLVKRPRLAVMSVADTADWKLRRLPSEPAARTAALDAILADAYENVESLFVRSRILDAAPGHRSLTVTEVDDALSVAVESVAVLPHAFLDASENVWTFWAHSDGLQLSFARYERLQTVGNDTVYCRVTACLEEGAPCIGMLYAIKRFVQDDRVVFVLKTVLEDEDYPWPPGLLVGNHTASIVVEAAGENQSIRRMVVAGKISTQLPDESPLVGMPTTIGEVVLKIVRPVFDTLEFLLS